MIAYDSNVLIYAVENVEAFANKAQEVVMLGESEGVAFSILAWQELMTGAVLQGGKAEEITKDVLSDLGLTDFLPVTQEIAELAVSLTKKYGRKLFGYDAIHIATAIEHKADYFVTNDLELVKLNISEIEIRPLQ
jgi:predicted nucleic acid-binding protein